MPFQSVLLLLMPALAGAGASSGVREQAPDFARQVRPIFASRCARCHAGDRPKAGLRLDQRAPALAGGRDGPVIMPGNPDASELLARVSSEDPEERMPPEGAALEPEQVDVLRRWIAAGAPWPDGAALIAELSSHWAYRPPVRPSVPADPFAVRGPWEPARNEIDRFVRARLAAEGLEPAPPADRRTLIRRASLDLTGLPPTPEEVAAFVADPDPHAWERVVDRLLASPACGEHLARAWLDLARYADTNGYEKDGARTMWRWRDEVIAACDRDQPFDQFTTEQLAGDLLPGATLEQKVASGFHRNTMTNLEGGVDPEEFRVAAVIDRVNTTAAVWLGTTLACAQCHDHKFDPFTQRDYYGLFAFFNSTADDGRSNEPRIKAPTPEQLARRPAVESEIAELEGALAAWSPRLEAELEGWAAAVRAVAGGWNVARPQSARAAEGSRLAVLDDGSVLAFGALPPEDSYAVTLPLEAGPLAALRLEVLRDESLPGGGPGRPSHGNFVLSELSLALLAPGEEPRPLALARARADHEQTDGRWPAAGAIDGDPATGWAIGGGTGAPHQLVVELAEPVEVPAGASLAVRLDQHFGTQHLIGRLRLSTCASALPEPLVLARPDREEIARRAQDDPRALEELREFWRQRSPALEPQRTRLAELRAEQEAPTALVMQELDTPRETHLFVRGSFLSPGERVEPHTPAVLHAWPAGAPLNRLGLARWLMSPRNPLTARVVANRWWARMLGRGIVATLDDFGLMGERPSHPELLDWLATELVRDGWSRKRFLRRIALSATYRQSSITTAELRARDPHNELLARGPRGRVEAEVVRDIALAASGLLDPRVGGPSVFPDQPDGIWRSTYSGDRWVRSSAGDRFRRGLYTFWKRTAPYPAFQTFDAPSRELTCTRRPRTNTPLQALVLLNDPAFARAALALGDRMRREGGSSDAGRVRRGFLLCTSREPNARELELLLELLSAERQSYAADAERALALVADGPAREQDPVERAAWAMVANALLNLDETVSKP